MFSGLVEAQTPFLHNNALKLSDYTSWVDVELMKIHLPWVNNYKLLLTKIKLSTEEDMLQKQWKLF